MRAIVRMTKGAMESLRKGTSEYTCMVGNLQGRCARRTVAMEWVCAWHKHTTHTQCARIHLHAQDGDTGIESIPIPGRRNRTPGDRRVVTGPHMQ